MSKLVSHSYDLNQSSAAPGIPVTCSALYQDAWWVSPALRSSRTSRDTSPLSEALGRSFVTLTHAVSEL